jgi:2-polyprenyl-3-methyl-5-hydroxy-6-metoxy-1,4-benzoquinol methylase
VGPKGSLANWRAGLQQICGNLGSDTGPSNSRLGERSQSFVDAHFEATASYWESVYEGASLSSVVYRQRRALALSWIDSLALRAGAPIVEVGCGPGLLSTALASRGFAVTAVDRVTDMLDAARLHAAEAGVSDRVSTVLGDVHSLEFDDGSFDLVLALGVLPWLHSPSAAMAEMARVLRPGGFLLASADNRAALTGFVEPLENPLLRPAKERLKEALERRGRRRRAAKRNRPVSRRELDRLIGSLGLVPVRWQTLGFGPFTFFRRRLLPERLGATLYDRLQVSADRGALGWRCAGAQHLFLARKQKKESP